MGDIGITLSIIGLALVLFAWDPVPAAVVATGAALALYFTGVLTMPEALTGFGDPVVVLIAALLAIAVAVEFTGVGTWAGQLLLRLSGRSEGPVLVSPSAMQVPCRSTSSQRRFCASPRLTPVSAMNRIAASPTALCMRLPCRSSRASSQSSARASQ